jgi:hypothetical protein
LELLVPLVLAQLPEILVVLLLPTGQDLQVPLETQATRVHLAMLGLEPLLAAQVDQHQLAGLNLPE